MKALFKLEYILVKRDVISFVLSIGMPMLFFLLFSSMMVFEDKALEHQIVRNYLVTLTAFSMSGFALFTLPNMLKEDEQRKWLVQIRQLPVPLSAYYAVKMIRVLIGFLLAILVNFSVGILVKNIVFSPLELLMTIVLLLVTSLLYIAIGLLIACLPSLQLITVVSNLAYFILAIFGGSWVPVSQFPEWMQQIAKVIPTHYANTFVVEYLNQQTFNVGAGVWVVGYTILFLVLMYYVKKKQDVQ